MRTESHDEINAAFAKLFTYFDARFEAIEKRFNDHDHEGRIQNLELSI